MVSGFLVVLNQQLHDLHVRCLFHFVGGVWGRDEARPRTSCDYHARSHDHKYNMASAGAELLLLETELTEALEEYIDVNFEESESRFDVKRSR